MSDNFGYQRSDSGNFLERRGGGGRRGETNSVYPCRRGLVEEAISVSIQDLGLVHRRRKMLRAADEGFPISISLGGKSLEAYLTFDIHRLPVRHEQWSDPARGDIRLWFVCSHCRRRARKLYIGPLHESDSNQELGCRKCKNLVYMSQYSGQRKWWRMSAAPIRRLLRQRNKLMERKSSQKVIRKLDEIERMLWIFKQRAVPKSPQRTATGKKRGYKNIELVFGLF
jgi:hypothetical protein